MKKYEPADNQDRVRQSPPANELRNMGDVPGGAVPRKDVPMSQGSPGEEDLMANLEKGHYYMMLNNQTGLVHDPVEGDGGPQTQFEEALERVLQEEAFQEANDPESAVEACRTAVSECFPDMCPDKPG